jgi:hypothetical protein
LASNVRHIRHWKIFNKSYEEAPNEKATWFIDPPYEKAGKHYAFPLDDYEKLFNFCKTRTGQAIVCEAAGATWLPFRPFRVTRTCSGKNRRGHENEMIWTNDGSEKTGFDLGI